MLFIPEYLVSEGFFVILVSYFAYSSFAHTLVVILGAESVELHSALPSIN